MKKLTLILVALLTASSAYSNVSWQFLANKLKKLGGSTHALAQVKCFMNNLEEREFAPIRPTDPGFEPRCFNAGNFKLSQTRFFAIVDYTQTSDRKRFYLIDRQNGLIENFAVAHGRYKAGYINFFPGKYKNTTRTARYFSNEINSNASSTGFFLAGLEYNGVFGRSLILNGLEEGVNHNACERAVVIHGSDFVSVEAASAMSSGCPMISNYKIDKVIDILGAGIEEQKSEFLARTGGLVYIYGPREKAQSSDSCLSLNAL